MANSDTHILLARCDWGSWRSPREIAMRLGMKNKVLFVENSPRYIQIRGQKGEENFLNRLIKRNLRQINKNLFTVTPPSMLPLHFSIISRYFHDPVVKGMIKLSKELLLFFIKSVLKELNWQADYLWMWYPYDAHLVGKLGEKLSVYRTFDEVGEWMSSKGIKTIIEELDVSMCKKVDYVLCSAHSQYEKRRKINPQTHFIPFGVNFAHFNKTVNSSFSPPADWPVKDSNTRVIGYAGTIDWRFDFELVEKLALADKSIVYVLIGPYRNYGLKTLERLCSLENLFWLGEKSFNELAGYIAGFDVCIIPYKVGPDTNTMRVYKVFEYLACGKPVVSTDIYEMRRLADIIIVADGFEEFQSALYSELNVRCNLETIKKRISAARKLDWDSIYSRFNDVIHFED